MSKNSYNILLYYCYTTIDNPLAYREETHSLCLSLNLRGRVIISKEGLNGTLCGLKENCKSYIAKIRKDKRFNSIEFKIQSHTNNIFPKLQVRLKKEIVLSKLKPLHTYKQKGIYLVAEDFDNLRNQQDTLLLDVRNDYEYEIGRFKGSFHLSISNFRDFQCRIDTIRKTRHKKIITYCTGGVRCEKATALLIEKGFKNVYQLKNGILGYAEQTGGKDFDGKCYVFDRRLAIDVNKINPTMISKCYVCQKTSNNIVNCANVKCNKHTIICNECMEPMKGACSKECRESSFRRDYSEFGYYMKKQNGYNPYKFSKRLQRKNSI